jgi:hypothetical protein
VTPYLTIHDDALRDPWRLRWHATGLSYRGEVAPDGVTYPNVNSDVPNETRLDLTQLLSQVVESRVDVHLMFFRLNPYGTEVPHWAHTDLLLGQYTGLVYLSAPEDCQGGTAILRHKSGMDRNPTTEDQVALWRRDTNRFGEWDIVSVAPMAFNRLVVMPSDLFHASVPQGFGSTPQDGRLVLISFFSKVGG